MSVFATMVEVELGKARKKHPEGMHSVHEAEGVIREEFEEWWEIAKRWRGSKESYSDRAEMLKELVQVSAMVQRAAEDLGLV